MEKNLKIAVYPGTFDPITFGHIDIIKRGLKIFDKIIILLAKNPLKNTIFTTEERISQIKEALNDLIQSGLLEIQSFNGLTVEYCKAKNIKYIIRGLRPLVDFEYEFEMAMANREMAPEIETIFILTEQKYFYLRSTLIKDLVINGANVSDKVPPNVEKALLKKLKANKL